MVFDRLKGMALILYNNTDFAQAAVRETKGWKIGGNKIKVWLVYLCVFVHVCQNVCFACIAYACIQICIVMFEFIFIIKKVDFASQESQMAFYRSMQASGQDIRDFYEIPPERR